MEWNGTETENGSQKEYLENHQNILQSV